MGVNRLMGQTVNLLAYAYVGSNPTAPIAAHLAHGDYTVGSGPEPQREMSRVDPGWGPHKTSRPPFVPLALALVLN